MSGSSQDRATTEDTNILASLHKKNLLEIEAGRLAQERGTSPEVREFGQQMVREHSEANRRVKAVASDCNIILPMVDPASQEARTGEGDPLTRLRELQGNEFDREFSRTMRQGHDEIIREVETARSSVSDPRVRALLDEMLPILKHHQESAAQLTSR